MYPQASGKKIKFPDSYVSSFDLEAMGQPYFLLISRGVWIARQKAVFGHWRESMVGSGLLVPAGPLRKTMPHLRSTLNSFLLGFVTNFARCAHLLPDEAFLPPRATPASSFPLHFPLSLPLPPSPPSLNRLKTRIVIPQGGSFQNVSQTSWDKQGEFTCVADGSTASMIFFKM